VNQPQTKSASKPQKRTACAVALGWTLTAPTAHAWWELGHESVCDAALALLSAPATEQLEQLMDGESFAEGCVWPDVVKNTTRKDTAVWHYLNIADDVDQVSAAPRPEKGDLITALWTQWQILADGQQSPSVRKDAVRFVGHFVGDLHQPLHLGRPEDWGGNRYKVTIVASLREFFGESDRATTKIHAIWDGYLPLYGERQANQPLQQIITDNAAVAQGPINETVIEQWAQESLDIARQPDVGYGADRLETLDETYLDAHRTQALSRLRLAAERLALMLETALAPSP
jgi:hypothetical protein